jgi:hypothetical protein
MTLTGSMRSVSTVETMDTNPESQRQKETAKRRAIIGLGVLISMGQAQEEERVEKRNEEARRRTERRADINAVGTVLVPLAAIIGAAVIALLNQGSIL